MSVIVKTGRFGQLTIEKEELIRIPQGILGFSETTEFCLVDPGDDTLILWLQSLKDPNVAFPVLEPKIFMPSYTVRLSAAEMRELKLASVNDAAVLSILTIPTDVTQMTANVKAPMVINLKEQLGRQVVLQENEYSLKHLMFKELRAHLITIASAQAKTQESTGKAGVVRVGALPASSAVRALEA